MCDQICKGLVYAGLALAILKFGAAIVLVAKPSSPAKLGSAALSFLMWPLYLVNGTSQSPAPHTMTPPCSHTDFTLRDSRRTSALRSCSCGRVLLARGHPRRRQDAPAHPGHDRPAHV